MSSATPATAPPDLSTLARLLRTVAGDEIMPRWRHAESSSKADGSLVTEADLAVQDRLTRVLAERWPEIPLLGEEMEPSEQARVLDGGTCWCLDPLDGTSNYTCGYPGFAISLALIQSGRIELGLVLDPLRDECFMARRGSGAWCDGSPLRPFAPGERLRDCIAVVDFKRLPPERIPALFREGSFRSQRNLGAIALEWCWLAAGRFQLYLHGGQRLWDWSAGRLIAEEAGIASALFARDGAEPLAGIGLEKRVAVAAATPRLMAHWRDFIGLPLWP
jgi:myo-inositol-1(or 4)-monophosphatase